MIDIKTWAAELAQKLQNAFGARLLFVGYQGSYGRGEATPESDIDIVTVLDKAGLDDLDAYRALVRSQPEGEKACGFLCGAKELMAWPRYDLYSLVLDTKPVLGDLRTLTPPLTEDDAREALRIGAANLYHGAVHTFLYSEAPEEALPELRKAAFFCLRLYVLLRDGVCHNTRRELEETLGLEGLPTRKAYERLIRWCGEILAPATDAASNPPARPAGT